MHNIQKSYFDHIIMPCRISPTSALLLCLQEIEEEKLSCEEKDILVKDLSELLLNGGSEQAICNILQNYADCLAEAKLEVSFDQDVIDNDPVRRFFESMLAKETLLDQVEKLDFCTEKRELIKRISLLLPPDINRENFHYCEARLDTPVRNDEIWDAIARLRYSHDPAYGYSDFSHEQRIQIKNLWEWLHFSLIAVQRFPTQIPLNVVYEKYFLHRSRERDSRYPAKTPVLSSHLGLMKSTMPLPYYNNLRVMRLFYHKKSDGCYPLLGPFNSEMFRLNVHPFSTSLSASLLAVIRAYTWLSEDSPTNIKNSQKTKNSFINFFQHFFICGKKSSYLNNNPVTEKKSVSLSTVPDNVNFFRCMIAALLYNSGGHSLYEFAAVFQIPELECEKMTLSRLFIDGNKPAFQRALHSTLEYQKTIFARKNVINEINSTRKPIS